VEAPESPVAKHVAFMKQAATADGRERLRLLTEIDRRSADSPLASRLQLGFLLTSPGETQSDTAKGEEILRGVLAGHSELHPSLKSLIELRLQEVEVRQALRVQLGEANGKIDDLLSIESSMEQQKTESQTRSR